MLLGVEDLEFDLVFGVACCIHIVHILSIWDLEPIPLKSLLPSFTLAIVDLLFCFYLALLGFVLLGPGISIGEGVVVLILL